jgi:hypothetical protein
MPSAEVDFACGLDAQREAQMDVKSLCGDVGEQLVQGNTHVKVPPGVLFPVIEEDGRRFVDFSADGTNYSAVSQGSKVWVSLSDLTIVAAMDHGSFVYCNLAYS